MAAGELGSDFRKERGCVTLSDSGLAVHYQQFLVQMVQDALSRDVKLPGFQANLSQRPAVRS
jgi:hypothetical protein